MHFPSKGATSDTSNMVDPKKIGNVLWSRTDLGNMVPLDLHGQIGVRDEGILNEVFEALQGNRKVIPVLRVIQAADWHRLKLIQPYLIESIKTRSEARAMMASGDWQSFWGL